MNDLSRQLQELHVLLEDGNRHALMPVGVTPTQYNLLRCLAEGGRQGMTVTQLAGAMLCTRGNATRLVRRLVELGLVQTRSAEHDQRIVVVTTTPQGKRAFRTADKLLREAAERRLAGISARDQATLARVTRNLSDLLRRDLAETSAAAALKR